MSGRFEKITHGGDRLGIAIGEEQAARGDSIRKRDRTHFDCGLRTLDYWRRRLRFAMGEARVPGQFVSDSKTGCKFW